MISQIIKKIFQHKLLTIIILVLISCGSHFAYQHSIGNKNLTKYLTAAVEKGTIIVSVSGSGQVSVLDQTDIKSKVSGDVIYLGVENGQAVKKGVLLVELDKTDAEEAIEDAQTALQQAQRTLDKMKGMTTNEGTIQGLKEKAVNDLNKAYEDGFNTVSNIFLDLPAIMSELHDIIFSSELSTNQWNISYYGDGI